MKIRKYRTQDIATWLFIALSAMVLVSYFGHETYSKMCEQDETEENYQSALGSCRRAQQFGWPIQWLEPVQYRVVLNNLGTSEIKLHRYEAAKAHLTDSLERHGQATPDDSRRNAVTLQNLGVLSQITGNPKQAEILYGSSIAMFDRIGLPCDNVAVQAGSALGSALNAFGKTEEAEALLLDRSQRNDACRSLSPYIKGVTLRMLAEAQTGNSKDDDALLTIDSAIQLLKGARGDSSLELASALSDRATILLALERFDECEESVRLALPMFERFIGGGSISAATARATLGSSLRDRGKLVEAMDEYTAADKIYLTHLGQNHPWRAVLLMKMATATSRLGRKPEALSLLREAERIRIAAFGSDSPQVASVRRAMEGINSE